MDSYRKIRFSSFANTYAGNQIMIIVLLAIILGAGVFLTVANFDENHLGGTVSGPYWVVPIVILAFTAVFVFMLKVAMDDWPRCPNHGKRLKIVKREVLEEPSLEVMSFECPDGDYSERRAADRFKKRPHRGGVTVSFGSGHSGGAGVGR